MGHRCGVACGPTLAASFILLTASMLMLAGTTQGAETERRELAIRIDNKPAGTYHLSVTQNDNGTITVHARANVSYWVFLYHYKYSFQGTEVWKSGRLIRLDSTSNDDGKRFAVHAKADGANLQVTVNGETTTLPGDLWTTTAWHAPAHKFRNHRLPMIDADTGRALHGRLEYVDQQSIEVAGNSVECAHYRVTDGAQMELYFDGHQRLVRQDTVEQGHATVLQLTGVEH